MKKIFIIIAVALAGSLLQAMEKLVVFDGEQQKAVNLLLDELKEKNLRLMRYDNIHASSDVYMRSEHNDHSLLV